MTPRNPLPDPSSVPRVPWDEFLPDFMMNWGPNVHGHAEHLTVIGPTGQGKTTLMLALLEERVRLRASNVVIIATKPRDATLTELAHRGWPIIREWPPGYGQEHVILWPKFGDVRTAAQRQRRTIEPILAEIFADGGRTVFIDEVAYFHENLGLTRLMDMFWKQGRSMNLLMLGGTQRPTKVPRAMFSEASWFAAFRTADEDELRRVGEIGGTDSKLIREVMRTLAPHEFLMVQTRTGVMVVSKVERGGSGGATEGDSAGRVRAGQAER